MAPAASTTSGKKARVHRPRSPASCDDGWLKPHLDELLADPPKVATRKASEMALEAINAAIARRPSADRPT